MKISAFIAVLAIAATFPGICHAGPFGLDPGMSRIQVVQMIGKSAIAYENKDFIDFKSVPLQSLYFDDYLCFFDGNNKLWSIHASSKLISSLDGENLRDSFDELKIGLEDKYGRSLYVTGSRNSTVKWQDVEPLNVFTGAYWSGDDDFRRSTHIRTIALEIKRYDDKRGDVELTYDFTTLLEDSL